jgi:beta-galactosidase
VKAVGISNGRELETVTLTTASKAARLRLSADRTRLKSDGQDLAFVTVEVVDQNGEVLPQADQAVTFQVEGAATLAGVGNGDMTTSESYQANPHRVYQGRELLVLRSTHTKGRIKLTATAPGLPPATINLRSAVKP